MDSHELAVVCAWLLRVYDLRSAGAVGDFRHVDGKLWMGCIG